MNSILLIKKYGFTLAGLAISAVLLLFTIINDIDLFEGFIHYLYIAETYEVDEFIIPFSIFSLFVFLNLCKRQKDYKIEQEKLVIYKAMLSSSHHVLNNFLNQMQIFKMTAEDTPDFDQDILKLYNQIIKNTSEQIDSLSNITTIDEESIFRSVAPKPNSNTANQPNSNKAETNKAIL